MKDTFFIVHALVNHDLDSTFCDVERFNQRVRLRDADGGFGLHFCRPICERERLVGGQSANVHFNDTALEHVLATEVLKHLGLGGVDDVAEIHVLLHLALERHFDRFRNWHGRFACGKGKGDRA